MKIYNVTAGDFSKYGRVLTEVETEELVKVMGEMPLPDDVVYEPSIEKLESLPVFDTLKNVVFGEIPIQVGYCNGHNTYLNALEYHRTSEINIAATDAILLLGCQQDIKSDFTYETAKVEAFLVPKGCAVEIYATTLHYAPCNADDDGFRVCVVLPKGTNAPLEEEHGSSVLKDSEDAMLAAKNKWLIGHKEGGLPEGSHIGLIGENICIAND